MINKEILNLFCWGVVTSFLIVQVGCASFPPPHGNSFYTEDEVVTVGMLTCDGLREYKEDWEASFKPVNISYPCPVEYKVAPVVPLAIGIVAPLAFGYVKDKLKQETANYVQQFGTTYFDTFWHGKDGKYSQKYYGFEITRKARRYNDKSSKKEKEEVFKLVYGVAEDKDGFFWLAPLYFKTSKTKAKVASWGGKHRIDTKVEIGLDAVWVDGRKRYHRENIAKFDPLMINEYEIDSPRDLKTSCNPEKDNTCLLLDGGLNSFAGVPISSGSSSSETGRFWLTVLVTESDTAKTKKYITDLSEVLDKNRDKIIDFIKKASE
jgi:hypothetical protein